LEFKNDSLLNCFINGEPKYVFNYKIISIKDSSFILLKRPEENYDQSYKHILSIKKDTLQIIPLYFILLAEYHIKSLQDVYFIHIYFHREQEFLPNRQIILEIDPKEWKG
jgi:hypothetical protein